jgi:hypothetical protein
MALTTVTLEDTAGMCYQIRADDETSVAQLMPAIIVALQLPIFDGDGRPAGYHLSYQGRRLRESETLASIGAQPDVTLIIVPELTAGGSWIVILATAASIGSIVQVILMVTDMWLKKLPKQISRQGRQKNQQAK